MKRELVFPAFLPDQTTHSNALMVAENVFPRVDGYGAVGSFSSVSDALPAAFKGGFSAIATNGTSYLFAGTASGLERYVGGAWSNLVTGMTVTGRWRFVQFGNYAVAVNGVETKVIDLTAGTAAALAGAPAGIAIAVVGDYVVIGQGAGELLNIYTSGFNNHTDWNPAGTGGATIQPMLTGGEVMGLAGGEYGVILQRERLVRMTRTGDSAAPFQFDEITPNVGCASKASVVQVGRTVFFLSNRGFMALEDGQALKPIGSEKVDRAFQAAVAREDYERLFASVDPQNKLVMWCVPGSPGVVWVYNFELDRWSTIKTTIDGVFSGYTSSQTLEQVSTTYPNMDTMPYSLDDPRFSGGSPRQFVVASGELGVFAGAKLPATIEAGFQDLVPGRIGRVRATRPITDAISGVTVTLDARARLGDDVHARASGDLRASGSVPVRISGRYIKPKLQVAAGTVWSFVQGMEFDLEPGGER